MSDESTVAKGGLFKGDDGKASGRKILGFGCAVAAVAEGAVGIFRGSDWKLVGVVAGLLLAFSAVMYGFLTAQNGKALIAAWKGGTP